MFVCVFKYVLYIFACTSLVASVNLEITSPLKYVYKRQASCKTTEFECANKDCIPSYNVCDGAKDCSDGSDEIESTCKRIIIRCPSNSFKCDYGACVDQNLRCDRKEDCADGSDEMGCPGSSTSGCSTGKFKCLNGECIDRFTICDGTKNCEDGSDETKEVCKDLRCPSNAFQCEYGACLEQSVWCNGVRDCVDGSDEACEPLTSASTPTDNSVPEGGCRLPAHPRHGEYVSVSCVMGDRRAACHNTPGAPVSPNWLLKYTCNANYQLNDDNDFSVCESGQWKKPLDCIKLCKPLVSLSVDVRCTYLGREVSCNEPMRPRTVAKPKCKQHYQEQYRPEYSHLTCRSDGEWDYQLYYCVPDIFQALEGLVNYEASQIYFIQPLICGVQLKAEDFTPLVHHGTPTRQGEFPWLVGIYMRKMPNGTVIKDWEQMCGGTLISPHIVLTAAHCLDYQGTVGRLNPEDIKVGLGKYYRDFKQQESSAVISDVRKIVIPEHYSGERSLYALDIALLDLTKSVLITAHIMPACVDWQLKNIIPSQGDGHIAGWGKKETGEPSSVVLTAQLTYINNKNCIERVPPRYSRLVTHDKFCSQSKQGEQADRGDSGGGFTILQDNLHFVIGVISTKILDQTSFAMFTNISNAEHHIWLGNHKSSLDNFHRET